MSHPSTSPRLVTKEHLLGRGLARGDVREDETLVPPPGLIPPTDSGTGKPLRVGQLATRTKKTVRALHLYEEMGLLDPSERSKGGYRLYGPGSVTRVEWISHLQDMGFSLPEIRAVLLEWKASASAGAAMQKVTDLYRQKLAQARAQIEMLQSLESDLDKSLHYLELCQSCEPVRVVTACKSCDRHDCDSHAPVLVAGFSAN